MSVSIIMGSESDFPIMKNAYSVLQDFGIKADIRVLSAHRTPDEVIEYVRSCENNTTKVFIAGAGGAAHLPGVIAGLTVSPVIGVPIASSLSIQGVDSLLSIVQMPSGIPVATVAIDGAKNAGLLAVSMLAIDNADIKSKLLAFRQDMKKKVYAMDQNIQKNL